MKEKELLNLDIFDEKPKDCDLVLAQLKHPERVWENEVMTLPHLFDELHRFFAETLDDYGVKMRTRGLLERPVDFFDYTFDNAVFLTLDKESTSPEQFQIQKLSLEILTKVLANFAFGPIYVSDYSIGNLTLDISIKKERPKKFEEVSKWGKFFGKKPREILPEISRHELELEAMFLRTQHLLLSSQIKNQHHKHTNFIPQNLQNKSLNTETALAASLQNQEVAVQTLARLEELIASLDVQLNSLNASNGVVHTIETLLGKEQVLFKENGGDDGEKIEEVLATLPRENPFDENDLQGNLEILFRVYAEFLGKVKDPVGCLKDWIKGVRWSIKKEAWWEKEEVDLQDVVFAKNKYCKVSFLGISQEEKNAKIQFKIYSNPDDFQSLKLPFDFELFKKLPEEIEKKTIEMFFTNVIKNETHSVFDNLDFLSGQQTLDPIFEGDALYKIFTEYGTFEEQSQMKTYLEDQKRIAVSYPSSVETLIGLRGEIAKRESLIKKELGNYVTVSEMKISKEKFPLLFQFGTQAEQHQTFPLNRVLRVYQDLALPRIHQEKMDEINIQLTELEVLEKKIQQELETFRDLQQKIIEAENMVVELMSEATETEQTVIQSALDFLRKVIKNTNHRISIGLAEQFNEHYRIIRNFKIPELKDLPPNNMQIITLGEGDEQKVLDFIQDNLGQLSEFAGEDHGKNLEHIPFEFQPGTYAIEPGIMNSHSEINDSAELIVAEKMGKSLENIVVEKCERPSLHMLLYFILQHKDKIIERHEDFFGGTGLYFISGTKVPDIPIYHDRTEEFKKVDEKIGDDEKQNVVGENYTVEFFDPEVEKGKVDINSWDGFSVSGLDHNPRPNGKEGFGANLRIYQITEKISKYF